MVRKYTHPEIGEDIRAIGGHYTTLREGSLSFGDSPILYSLSVACVDSSCCGEGGCVVLTVVGRVLAWQSETDDAGHPVSVVEPIDDTRQRAAISAKLRETEKFGEIVFWASDQLPI